MAPTLLTVIGDGRDSPHFWTLQPTARDGFVNPPSRRSDMFHADRSVSEIVRTQRYSIQSTAFRPDAAPGFAHRSQDFRTAIMIRRKIAVRRPNSRVKHPIFPRTLIFSRQLPAVPTTTRRLISGNSAETAGPV